VVTATEDEAELLTLALVTEADEEPEVEPEVGVLVRVAEGEEAVVEAGVEAGLEAGTAVAAHEQTANALEEAANAVRAPQELITQLIAKELMAASALEEHWQA